MNPSTDRTAELVPIEPAEPGSSTGHGVFGVFFFAIMGVVAYGASQSIDNGSTIALVWSIISFMLAAAALYGTVHVTLASRIPLPVLELQTRLLVRGSEVQGRLVQSGPVTFNSLHLRLRCKRIEFEEATRESLRSATGNRGGEYETESVTIDRGETQLAEIDLLKINGLRVNHGDQVEHPFTVNVPKDVRPSGHVADGEFTSHQIVWSFALHGDASFWPDSHHEYSVRVV